MNDLLGSYQTALPSDVKPADFAYWARNPKWYGSEAVALALGADPDSAKEFVNRSEYRGYNYKGHNHPFKIAYEKLMLLIGRKFPGILTVYSKENSLIVLWLEQARLPLPSDLKKAMLQFGDSHIDWRSNAEALASQNLMLQDRVSKLEAALADQAIAGAPATRERESLLKIVIGMAVAGYRYDHKSGRSTTAKEIAGDLDRLGISLSDDTIRKYLKEAAELMPPKLD